MSDSSSALLIELSVIDRLTYLGAMTLEISELKMSLVGWLHPFRNAARSSCLLLFLYSLAPLGCLWIGQNLLFSVVGLQQRGQK